VWLVVDAVRETADTSEKGSTLAPNEKRPHVAILGMGKMGQALAGRLLDQGWPILIWNRSPKDFSALEDRGAVRLHNFDDLWDRARIVVTFLANDDALASVCFEDGGVLRSGASDRVLVDMSTVSPRISTEIAARAEAVGVDFLRSPVSGNPSVLSAGNITLIVSGPRATFERVADLLHAIGPTVLYVGDAEHSRTLKLAINAGLAITAQMMAELIVLGENSGIDRSTLLEAMGESVLGSPFVRYKTAGLVNKDYSATFTTNLLIKDLELALDVAHSADLSLPVIELVNSLTHLASDNGYGDVDFASLLPNLQLALGKTPDVEPSPPT
jgi:3-hydroxyisobutyrate dehydrogenase-like beta-hydroxyacid dehydrogenase